MFLAFQKFGLEFASESSSDSTTFNMANGVFYLSCKESCTMNKMI